MEDKCKSSVRKKRILTKRYWVHFMSNGSSANSDMMDDNSEFSPATLNSPNPFPNLKLNTANMNNAANNTNNTNPRSASMAFKRHSCATLPSYNTVKRVNQGLSGGSSTFSQLSDFNTMMDTATNMGNLTLDSSDSRSPRQQAPFYHPYKSPRMSSNDSSPQLPPSTSNSSNPPSRNSLTFTQSPLQHSPQQQSPAYNNGYAFPGLEAYKLDQPPNYTNMDINSQHSGVTPTNNSSSVHPRSLYPNTKSLSESNLLPPPSSILSSNNNSTYPQQLPQNHHDQYHIPPIVLDQHGNSTTNLHPQQISPHQLSPHTLQNQQQPPYSFNNNSMPPNGSTSGNTPRGVLYYGNEIGNSPRSDYSGSDYIYSPRSDFSSLTSSPRMGNDSNSSTPRGLIPSMSGMSLGPGGLEPTPVQQPTDFNTFGANLNTGNNGNISRLGKRGSGQFHQQQLSYDSALNVPGMRKSVAGYLNSAGNRFSLGTFSNHGSAYNSGGGSSYGVSGVGGFNPNAAGNNGSNIVNNNSLGQRSGSSQQYSNHPYNRYSLGPNQDLYFGLPINNNSSAPSFNNNSTTK